MRYMILVMEPLEYPKIYYFEKLKDAEQFMQEEKDFWYDENGQWKIKIQLVELLSNITITSNII